MSIVRSSKKSPTIPVGKPEEHTHAVRAETVQRLHTVGQSMRMGLCEKWIEFAQIVSDEAEYTKLTQRPLAAGLGYSQSWVSFRLQAQVYVHEVNKPLSGWTEDERALFLAMQDRPRDKAQEHVDISKGLKAKGKRMPTPWAEKLVAAIRAALNQKIASETLLALIPWVISQPDIKVKAVAKQGMILQREVKARALSKPKKQSTEAA